jgi:hypothetical protein
MNRLLTLSLLTILLVLAVCGCGAQVSGDSLATVKTAAQIDSGHRTLEPPGCECGERSDARDGPCGPARQFVRYPAVARSVAAFARVRHLRLLWLPFP